MTGERQSGSMVCGGNTCLAGRTGICGLGGSVRHQSKYGSRSGTRLGLGPHVWKRREWMRFVKKTKQLGEGSCAYPEQLEDALYETRPAFITLGDGVRFHLNKISGRDS